MNLFTFIRDKFAPKSQDAILLKACRDGNPHAARVALKNGANPNTLIPMGEYSYSPWVYEPQYTGTVNITPILLAATSAFNKEDSAGYYAVIEILAKHPQTDLTRVVTGHKKEWRSEHHHQDGYPPEFEEDYHFSLRQVLNQSQVANSLPAKQPSDLYPITPEMSLFLMGFSLKNKGKDSELTQAFSYLVDGLIAHDQAIEKRLMAKAADQKIASL